MLLQRCRHRTGRGMSGAWGWSLATTLRHVWKVCETGANILDRGRKYSSSTRRNKTGAKTGARRVLSLDR
jgi:hypothetical protein